MSPTGLAIIYIIIWWIVFFAILPIDVERKKIVKVEGEDPGSPENPKMMKKFIFCTGITSILINFFLSTSIGKIAKKTIHQIII